MSKVYAYILVPMVASLHIPFADIFVMQSWSANGPGARSQIPLDHILGDPALFHSVDITKLV